MFVHALALCGRRGRAPDESGPSPRCSPGPGSRPTARSAYNYVEGGVVVGVWVTIKNGVQLFSGVTVEDEVFLGPGAVFTNVPTPAPPTPRARPAGGHPGPARGHRRGQRHRPVRPDHRLLGHGVRGRQRGHRRRRGARDRGRQPGPPGRLGLPLWPDPARRPWPARPAAARTGCPMPVRWRNKFGNRARRSGGGHGHRRRWARPCAGRRTRSRMAAAAPAVPGPAGRPGHARPGPVRGLVRPERAAAGPSFPNPFATARSTAASRCCSRRSRTWRSTRPPPATSRWWWTWRRAPRRPPGHQGPAHPVRGRRRRRRRGRLLHPGRGRDQGLGRLTGRDHPAKGPADPGPGRP